MLEFEVGKVALFQYPSRNRFGVPLEYRWRRVLVTDIREIDFEPLSTMAIQQRPLVRRGMTLLYGIDRETGEERKFYVSAMKHGHPQPLQIILLNTEEPDDSPEPVSRLFQPTAEDRNTLVETLEYLKERCQLPPHLHLAIRAVEVAR